MIRRAHVKPEITRFDTVLEFAGWAVFILLWIFVGTNYSSLPDTVPTHFNAAIEPDGYGARSSILVLCSIGSLLFIGMSILNRYPDKFNYPVKITEENAVRQYGNLTRMVRWLKTLVLAEFGSLAFYTIQISKGGVGGFSRMLIPLFLVAVLIAAIYHLLRAYRLR
ncbi:MAG: hypothetical protein RLZZ630_1438 [Bacteroidota bacterium]|jgi:uncharacterized membrane protein